MRRVLEPFKDATEALEGYYIALPLVPRIMSALDSHIEAGITAFVPGSSSTNATEVMLLDHSDRWDELPNVIKIAATLSARTKGFQWLHAAERTLGRRIVLVECKKLFQGDIAEEVRAGSASNGNGGPEVCGVDGGETPRTQERGCLKRCVATAKAVGAGDDEEVGGLDAAVGNAEASINSTAPPLTLTSRMQAIEHVELERFTLEKGLDDDNDSDESTGEDDLSYLIVVPAPVCVPNPR